MFCFAQFYIISNVYLLPVQEKYLKTQLDKLNNLEQFFSCPVCLAQRKQHVVAAERALGH